MILVALIVDAVALHAEGLGMVSPSPEAWEKAKTQLEPGERVRGVIVHHAVFGAFVKMEGVEDVRGHIPIIEVGFDPPVGFPVGCKISAEVLAFHSSARQVLLGKVKLAE